MVFFQVIQIDRFMDPFQFVVSVHPDCIEGAQFFNDGESWEMAQGASALAEQMPLNTQKSVSELSRFLQQREWQEAYVSVIVPTTEVSFRTLSFPFQNRKKLHQVLRYEAEQELLDSFSDLEPMYQIESKEGGSLDVLLFLIKRSYLDQIKSEFNQQGLLIKNIDFSAHALFKTVVPEPVKRCFQIYLGVDEVFINLVENGKLSTTKAISHQVMSILKELIFPRRINRPLLYELTHPSESGMIPDDVALSSTMEEALGLIREAVTEKYTVLLHQELGWISQQLNLFLKTQGFFIELDKLQIFGALHSMICHEESGFIVQKFSQEELQNHFQTRGPYGILETLSQQGAHYLNAQELSFYSEGTPWNRFLKKNRWSMVGLLVCGVLLLGSLGWKWWMGSELVTQDLATLDQQIIQSFPGPLSPELAQDPKQAIIDLSQKIQQKSNRSVTRVNLKNEHILIWSC